MCDSNLAGFSGHNKGPAGTFWKQTSNREELLVGCFFGEDMSVGTLPTDPTAPGFLSQKKERSGTHRHRCPFQVRSAKSRWVPLVLMGFMPHSPGERDSWSTWWFYSIQENPSILVQNGHLWQLHVEPKRRSPSGERRAPPEASCSLSWSATRV